MSDAPPDQDQNHSKICMQRTDDDLSRFLVSLLEQTGSKVTQPTVSLLNGMRYTPSHQTNLRESFQRIKEAQEATQ